MRSDYNWSFMLYKYVLMLPSKKEVHFALLLPVCLSIRLSVCLSVHRQFMFIFFAEVAFTEIKFGKQIYHVIDISRSSLILSTINQYLTGLCNFLEKIQIYITVSVHFLQ